MTQEHKTGMTFFDYCHHHPKTVIFVALILLLLIGVLIWQRIPVKAGPVELGGAPTVLHDTVFLKEKKPVIDTLTYKPQLTSKNSVKESQPPTRKTAVKVKDTSISVEGQPANINTGVNNGIIGNSNNITIPERPIVLKEGDKQWLLERLKEAQQKMPTEKQNCIEIFALSNNERSNVMAHKIMDFFKMKGYSVRPSMRAYMTNGMEEGVEFTTEDKDCITVYVHYIK